MRQYGLEKGASSPGKQRAHNACPICQPDDPTHGTARARLKIDTSKEITTELQARTTLDKEN